MPRVGFEISPTQYNGLQYIPEMLDFQNKNFLTNPQTIETIDRIFKWFFTLG